MSFGNIESFMVENLTNVDTAQKYPLGMIVRAVDPTLGMGEFIYLKGVTSCAVGSMVTYHGNAATLLVADGYGPVAVAMAAVDAATKYGWFQISGIAKTIINGAVADAASVYATAAGGKVDDAVVAGDRVKNARFAAAGAAQNDLVSVQLARPFADNAEAA